MVCHLLPFAKVGQCREDKKICYAAEYNFIHYIESYNKQVKCVYDRLYIETTLRHLF